MLKLRVSALEKVRIKKGGEVVWKQFMCFKEGQGKEISGHDITIHSRVPYTGEIMGRRC